MAKEAKKPRIPTVYRTYSFADEDPILGVMLSLVDDSKLTVAEINERTNVSKATIYNWKKRKTKRPQFCTIAAVAGAVGKSIGLVNKKR